MLSSLPLLLAGTGKSACESGGFGESGTRQGRDKTGGWVGQGMGGLGLRRVRVRRPCQPPNPNPAAQVQAI